MIITEPSKRLWSNTIDMNIAGVVARPQHLTPTPRLAIPALVATNKFWPLILESIPMPTFNWSAGF